MGARTALLTGSAALLKVSCGSDDLVWLAPFIARETSRVGKLWVSLLYSVSVAALVAIAAALGAFAQSLHGKNADILKWWLKCIAGGLLVLYSVYMAYDEGWMKPCGLQGSEDSDDGDDKEEALLETEPSSGRSKKSGGNIVIVALLGSLDDFTVYLIIAGSGIYTWYELILGTVLGCFALAGVVLFLTESESLSHVLSNIPAWLILLALGVIVLADLF
mmetsp:Transcript_49536/g.118029  ORF Transcript_49536/g.118029 Transcript_49536/m.118029 type:complete len:219 (-) Transcript_49536:113-769(-)|eukprot:CAMPEP_0181494876 /NCGR_PEP_ID=MMETSP1110-20121109/52057_1 /TAXON_ID=174948 /ORGANISM="Symbiodinium sp., Strain CCMP421" /LENGTH=218 /DNA_ID=CAMNT_0023622421 /DNA_START=8 /DNA_END=664 /DNA_ORIENTATION=-